MEQSSDPATAAMSLDRKFVQRAICKVDRDKIGKSIAGVGAEDLVQAGLAPEEVALLEADIKDAVSALKRGLEALSPTLAVQNMTPEEAWSGRKPNVDHFRIFGCIAYARIPEQLRRNRDVVFDEDCFWPWNSNVVQQVPAPVVEETEDDVPTVDPHNQQNETSYELQSKIVISFETAVKDMKWQKAMDEEMESIEKNNTWELTELQQGQKAIGVKWPIFQLDVKSAFLHGNLVEYVFVHQPPGYIKAGNEDKCPYEHTLFVMVGEGGKMLIVCLYVDDLVYTGNDSVMFEMFKKSMMLKFAMSDLRMMHYFLGIEVKQTATGIFICQKKYVKETLERFGMKGCNSASTPMETGLKLVHKGRNVDSTLYKQIVGNLMYLIATRPDIMHAGKPH
ncbi:PREDICTED: uncharacterized protein LOC109174409 [Ipomoea nil]|uniref:uncharacterized protein LOC109174409 n=1 Tax=Ipomoea nil TaxID=35883 RepID=UPI00090093C2|nr:PREDICTED: uncharacterized protein LOC109174409 [Ipomoea nil]